MLVINLQTAGFLGKRLVCLVNGDDRPVLLFPASLQMSWSAGYNVTILCSLTAFVPEIQVVK